MEVAIVGKEHLSQEVAARVTKEGLNVSHFDANPEVLIKEMRHKSFGLFLALTDDDECNLVSCALVKQLGPIQTVASLKKPYYFFQESVDLQRAFRVDHLIFSDLLVADRISQIVFGEGTHSREFLHGNVQLRTLRVLEESSFVGLTIAEIREEHPHLLIGLIHRPKKVLATSSDKAQYVLGKQDEIIFPHGDELIMSDDEITIIGDTESILKAVVEISGEQDRPTTACIVGGEIVGVTLAQRLTQRGLWVRLEAHTVNMQELNMNDVFVACGTDEEHNFVLALQAKDRGLKNVIAILSDKATCEEADKLGIAYVSAAPTSAADEILELIQGDRVSSLMSMYDACAEILQLTVSDESPITGIPLSVLGPRLPKELLIGVIYTRGRLFIAEGSHILKPQDECLVIASPKHRSLLEEIF